MSRLTPESNVALRIAHLGMIQGAVTRMSGFSASAKTFIVTILAGLAAISLQADAVQLGVIAMIATIVLATIDAYYMTMELRFRAFYDQVVARDFDDAANLGIAPLRQPGDVKRAINSRPSKLFYLPVLFACVLFIGYGLVHDRQSKRLPRTDTPRVEQPANAKPAATAKRLERLVQPTLITQRATGRPISGQSVIASLGQSLRNEATAERAGRPVGSQVADTSNR